MAMILHRMAMNANLFLCTILGALLLGLAEGQLIFGFTLVNSDTDQPIQVLAEGDSVDLALVGEALSITADTSGSIGSVKFFLDGQQVRTESFSPYALGGDIEGDYAPVSELTNVGSHVVAAEAYSQSGASGSLLDSNTVTFFVTDNSGGPTPTPPTPTAPPTPATTTPPAETDVPAYPSSTAGTVSGELKTWHKITLGFQGPSTSEAATPNPFTDYRLDVLFEHSVDSVSYLVPGYYAADGNAANSHATSGNVWLTHFSPDRVGTWTWTATFVQGSKVAQNGGGTSAGFFDGASGSFVVTATDKTGRDLRGKGRLEYVGMHHLQFAETGEFFLKAGADSPENFLAYEDFDDTPNNGKRRKSWQPHAQDYNAGDPTWSSGVGTEIIGAVNYLSEQGMNVFSFLPMNIDGDDKNVFPYVSNSPGGDRQRIDVSKTAQWEVVFEHADTKGMYLHFKTQETENDQLLDGGQLGDERKLYYRELVARFGHHLALNWNIGEENTNTDAQRKAFATFFKQVDPYDHPVVIHTFPGQKQSVYGPLIGYPDYDGVSLQSDPSSVFGDTLEWRDKSAVAGVKWVVANDEQGIYTHGVVPDSNDPSHDSIRKDVLWGNLMAGGAGVEYYFGYSFPNSDLTCEDFRSRANMWEQSRYALEFFSLYNVPFWDMANANQAVSNGWCLAKSSGDVFVVYLKSGGSTTLDIPSDGPGFTTYSVMWYDPRNGGALQTGSVLTVTNGNGKSLGVPPSNNSDDWVILVEKLPPVPTVAPAPTMPPTTSPTVEQTPSTPSPGGVGQVTSFVLVNSASDTELRTLVSGSAIDLSTDGTSLNVKVNINGVVESVVFGLDGDSNFRTENFSPYALGGDSNSDYSSVAELMELGWHTVTATPYSENGGSGIAGSTATLTIEVVP